MHFIDEATITVRSGDGGRGCVSFRREKFVPRGGPDGGNGGNGGSVLLEVSPSLSTLLDFRYRNLFKAARGQHGMGKNMHGKGASDRRIAVPPGTVVADADTGEILADLTRPGETLLVAKGGRGGRGNSAFTSSVNQAPDRAEPGHPGRERRLRLELKMIAQVGLIGLPNAGKSTLLSHISRAHPKIADYPFTTLTPHLGVVDAGESRSFVVADIPGLIQGAARGAGLGTRFLRHVERTRLLLHLVDVSPESEQEPIERLEIIETELASAVGDLVKKPQMIVATKIDTLPPEGPGRERLESLARYCGGRGLPFAAISAVSGAGIEALVREVARMLRALPRPDAESPLSTESPCS